MEGAFLAGKVKVNGKYYDFHIELEKHDIEDIADEIEVDNLIHNLIREFLRNEYGEDVDYLDSIAFKASATLYLKKAFPFDDDGIYTIKIPYTEFFRILGQKTFLTRYLQNGKLKGTMPMLVDRAKVIAKNGNDEYIGNIVIFPDSLAFTHSLP